MSDDRKNNNRIPDSEFESNKQIITQDIENTLERVVNDYSNHWQGVIGEAIQNSYDAWCTNRFTRECISRDHELVIELEVNINHREFIWKDNAGGMPESIFYENFSGLDTPGEEKQSGGAGGAYGRGFHVISGLGDETYAETLHNGFHGGLVVRGAHQAEYNELDDLSTQGTRVRVVDCDLDVMVNLSNTADVIQYIQNRFQKMLEHEDVTVLLSVDGESTAVEPIDLSKFEILWEGEIDFEHAGEEKTLTNCVIYEKGDREVPFEGMSMCKRHEDMGQPYMQVKQYRPHQVRHLGKMFGFCDASVLCPEYENNAHTGWVGNVLPAGIKQKFLQIERDEFIGGPTEIEQRDEIVSAALDALTGQWDENPFDVSIQNDELDFSVPDDEQDSSSPDNTEAGVDLEGSQQQELDLEQLDTPEDIDLDDVYIDGDAANQDETTDDEGINAQPEDDSQPVLRCQTKRRTFDSDETVDIRVTVENPEGTDETEYQVDAEVEDNNGETDGLDSRSISVAEGDTSGGTDGWKFEPGDRDGKFVFRAELHQPSAQGTPADSTNTYFFVGDSIEEETGRPQKAFLEDIEFFPDPDDDGFRHELSEGDEAFVLYVNPSHPEYQYAEQLDGRSSTEHQIALLVRWGQEAIMNYLLLDRFESELRDVVGEDQEPLDDRFSEFVRDNLVDGLSTFSAETYRRLN